MPIEKQPSIENETLLAIRKTCLNCMGGNKELVEKCKADCTAGKSQCSLWEYRSGPLTDAKRFKKDF